MSLLALTALTIAGQLAAQNSQAQRNDAAANSAPRPHEQPDQSLISISGTVGAVTATAFTLNYGRGRIDVELDDADPQPETSALHTGDRVTVSGRIDDGFFSAARIEASSVYVERLGRHLFASDVDEERGDVLTVTPVSPSTASVRGVVSEVHDGRFTVDSAERSVIVSVTAMRDNPLDESGDQRVEVGDTVAVHGTIEDDFLANRRIEATAVTTVIEGID